MVRGKNRIPYWIDWRLTGLAEPDYGATISFGLHIEPEDSQYGKYRLSSLTPASHKDWGLIVAGLGVTGTAGNYVRQRLALGDFCRL